MTAVLDNCTYQSCVVLALTRQPTTLHGVRATHMVLAFIDDKGAYSLPYCHYGKTHTFTDPYSGIIYSFCRLTGLPSFDIEKTAVAYDQTSGNILTAFKSTGPNQHIDQETFTKNQLAWVFVTDDRLDTRSKLALKALLITP